MVVVIRFRIEDFCSRDDGRQSRSSCTVIVEGRVSEEGGM